MRTTRRTKDYYEDKAVQRFLKCLRLDNPISRDAQNVSLRERNYPIRALRSNFTRIYVERYTRLADNQDWSTSIPRSKNEWDLAKIPLSN